MSGILSKHLGSPEPFEVGEDKIYLQPLGIEELPLFLKALKGFSGIKKDSSIEDLFKNLDDASVEALKKVISITLDRSLPNEPEADRKVFGLKYMMQLLPKIIELNMDMDASHEATKKRELIEKMQQR